MKQIAKKFLEGESPTLTNLLFRSFSHTRSGTTTNKH